MATHYLSAGITSTGIILYSYDNMYILYGGTADNTLINYRGEQYVSSGGVADATTINGGSQYISNGGLASSTLITSWGYQYIFNGGVASSTVVNSSGYQYISRSGVADNTTVNDGYQYVYSGGTAHNTVINQYGGQYIFSGGAVNATTINSGGKLYISSGGMALDVVLNSGGTIDVAVYKNDSQTKVTGTHDSGNFYLSNGVAYNFLLNSGNYLNISSGGVADSTKINGGSMYIFNSGTANSTTINSGGCLYVSRGAVASDTVISNGGTLYLYSGGSAINLHWAPFTGDVYNYGGYVTFAALSGCYYGSGGVLYTSAATISSLTIINNASMYVMNGGNTDRIVIDQGYQYVSHGGTANSTTVSGGYQYIASGGVANNTIVNGGSQTVSSGGVANSATVNSGSQTVSSGGVASSTTVNGGHQYVYGSANSTVINSRSYQHISNGGVANSTIVNSGGKLSVYNGGVVSETVIHSGGSMSIMYGSLLGVTRIGGFMSVVATDAKGGTIFMDVSKRKATNDVIIDNIMAISNAKYYITVSADQEIGSYKLAAGAANFLQSISVYTTDNILLGAFSSSVNKFSTEGRTYLLSNTSDILSLTISGSPHPITEPRTNLLDNGYSQIVAWDAEKGKVGYVATNGLAAPAWAGIWEWGGNEAAMWKVVGVGQFSADVEHDGILLYNGNGNTFAAWTDLGQGDYGYVSLCHVDGNFQTLALADFDNNGLDDVIIYDENGSFGIVSDAAAYHDVWHVDNAETNVQQVIGAGYFGNADGKSDILVKQTNENAYFLWHNEDPTFNTWNWSQTYLGSLDDDWVVAAIGDFQGDGVADIIMWQKSTGFMYAWEDAKSSNRRWVGELDASQWEVAAVGDYNGDGKEDLLLRELVSGWGGVGYWASANASNWTDLNARIETDMESKFAIVA